MLDKEKVWISDPHDGFILGRIIDLTEEGAMVEHLEGKKNESIVSFEQVFTKPITLKHVTKLLNKSFS